MTLVLHLRIREKIELNLIGQQVNVPFLAMVSDSYKLCYYDGYDCHFYSEEEVKENPLWIKM